MNVLQSRCETIRHMATRQQGIYYPLTNIATYGNFAADSNSDGFANGLTVIGTPASQSVSGNVQIYKAAANLNGFYMSYPAVGGRSYYYTMTARCSSTAKVFPYDGFTQNDSVLATDGQYHTITGVKTLNASATYLRLYIQSIGVSGYADTYCKQWMILPLDGFGSGNEPTAAQVNAALAADGANYWDGTRNVLFNLAA